jgi:acyl carrier protein
MVTYDEACTRTRKVIADSTNRDVNEIRPDQNLKDDLGFTDLGKRALAAALNREFEKEGLRLSPEDTAKCVTVGDVCDVVWAKLPLTAKKQ